MRGESYSNRFATALEGDNPARPAGIATLVARRRPRVAAGARGRYP
jgi:hypothetical protein